MIDHQKTSNHHGQLSRRSFLAAAGRLTRSGLAAGAVFEPHRGTEGPLRTGLLRTPEHLGRLGTAKLFEVPQC